MTVIEQLVVSGLLIGGIYALVSLGLTLVYGSLHLVNFAHGDYLMIAMYLAWELYMTFHINPYVSIVIVIPAMFVLGGITYLLVIRPVLRSSRLVQVFITFGLSIIVQNLALMIFNGDERSVDLSFARRSADVGGVHVTYTAAIAFVAALATAAVLYLFMRRSYVGKAIRATGQNTLAAQLQGINANRARLITFGISTALLGVAGPMLIPIYSVYPTIGQDFILVAFIVVVLGGLGSFAGAVAAGLLVGVVQTVSSYYVNSQLAQAILLLLLIVILVVRPSGMFGTARLVGSGGH